MDLNKIIIADDHPLFREGLELALLQIIPAAKIYAAADGKQVLEIMTNKQVDMIFLDIRMPGMDGIEITRSIRKFNFTVKIVAVSMFDDRATVVNIFKAGANGYIHKNTDKRMLKHVIETVGRGEIFLSEELNIYKNDVSINCQQNKKSIIYQSSLSEREYEILMLICNQYSSKEIANKLCLTEKTVETHRNHLMSKTKSKNVVGLTMFAIENGYFLPAQRERS